MPHSIHGTYVALPTPFRDGRVDLDVLEELIERLAETSVEGLLITGTTGEVPTLNDYEHRSLIHAAVDFNRGRLAVMAGIGTNCTRRSVELAGFAASSGVDSLLAVTPYYNRPSRRGLLLHYGQIAEASKLPLVLYNVPTRTGVDLEPVPLKHQPRLGASPLSFEVDFECVWLVEDRLEAPTHHPRDLSVDLSLNLLCDFLCQLSGLFGGFNLVLNDFKMSGFYPARLSCQLECRQALVDETLPPT